MQTPTSMMLKASTSALTTGLRSSVRSRCFSSRTIALAYDTQASRTRPVAALRHGIQQQPFRRCFQSSSRSLAEEVKSSMPFESNVMNLLANNEEFRELVGKLADRMQVLIGIDVNEGHLPTMEDMMRCAQDPELQELSIRLTKILSDDGVNLSPETLKYIWDNMQGKGR